MVCPALTMAVLPQLLSASANSMCESTKEHRVHIAAYLSLEQQTSIFFPFIALNVLNRADLLAKHMTLFGQTIIPNNYQVLSLDCVCAFLCTLAMRRNYYEIKASQSEQAASYLL